VETNITQKGRFNKRFLDWNFNILQLAVYFVNIPILKELHSDSESFDILLGSQNNESKNLSKGRAWEFQKVEYFVK
jgi:hypothetical protein